MALLAAGFALGAGWLYQLPTGPPAAPELRLRLNYLEAAAAQADRPGSALAQLDRENPEWGLFSRSFFAYALANLARRDSAYRPEATRYVALLLRQVLAARLQEPFRWGVDSVAGRVDTAGSVLYLGHLNLMLGCHRQLNPRSPFAGLHDTLSAALARRLARDSTGCLESYPRQRWLPDNAVAAASLALHGRLAAGSPGGAAARRWLAGARRRYLDPQTHLLASAVNPRGEVADGPRGSMLGWAIWFLGEVDPAFAADQYRRFQAASSVNLGLMRLYRERPGDYATGPGDVDSGPLLLGFSIPATAFALADATALGDAENARRLRRVVSFGSREVVEGRQLRYAVRFVDLDVSPLAEALLLWAEVGPELSRE